MGLKSGSRDAGLEETEEDKESAETTKPEPTDGEINDREQQTNPIKSETTDAASAAAETNETEQRPAMSAIPYKLRREKVNEGREQVPYFLREEIIDAEDELQDTLEEMLGESVYKSDYREAAMVVAQRNPKLVAEILREWGYDLELR